MAMQVKMEDVDRLSDLPDLILSHILSFLSTKEAVGTSILSSRWRHLFTLVPNLDFDLEDEENKSYSLDSDSFISFVDKLLFFNNKGTIDKFRLKSEIRRMKRMEKVDSNCVYRWISAAAGRGVKHLDLSIWHDQSTTFPCVVFTCRTLVTLKLDIRSLDLDVPKSVHLPNLKILHLSKIYFSNDDSFKCLLSGCISLEDMVIRDCCLNFNLSHHLLKRLTIDWFDYFSSYEIMIDTPNLAYFKCSDSNGARLSLENMQSLVEADIDIYRSGNRQVDAMAVFTGISNVHSLLMSTRSLKLLLTCEPLPIFANLAELEIRYCPGHKEWSTSTNKGLETLLTSSPELEKLSFYLEFLCCLPEEVPPCLLYKLKVMEVSGFINNKNCIEKAKYILKNGGALEKLTIRTSPDISEAERLKIYQVLLGSPRKAKQCSVLVLCHSSCGCEIEDEDEFFMGNWTNSLLEI